MPTTTINFNTGTVGAAITGWTQSSGNPFTYRAGTGSTPFTTQGAGSATPANDQWAIYTAGGSITGSVRARVTQYMQVSGASWQGLGITLCSDSTYTNAYHVSWDQSSGLAIVYKKVGASYNVLGTSGVIGPTRTAGDPVTIDVDYDIATHTLSVKVWDPRGSEPGSYSYSVVDSSSPYTGGYVGFRLGKNDGFALGGTLNDDFVYTVPDAGPTSYTLTGPSAGRPSVASTNFTVTLNSAATSTVTITPSDSSGGGTFTPSTVSITTGNTTGTFTYTAASTGAKTISTTDDAGLTDPSSLTFTAYSLSLSPGSQSVANSVAASLTATLTPSGAMSATATAGTLSTASPTSGTPFTLTTPSSGSGTATVTVTGLGGTSQTATVSYAPAAATALTLTGPSAVPVGSASSNFTIGCNGSLASPVTVTVTVTPSGGTVTSTPVTLSAGVGSTGTFTYTAATAGTYTVAITNGSGLTNPSSLTVVATAVSTLNFLFPAGVSGLSTVGFTLVDLTTDTQYQAFTTAGVSEPIAGSGVYVVNVSLPKTLHVACLWSLTSGGVTKYINEFLPRS